MIFKEISKEAEEGKENMSILRIKYIAVRIFLAKITLVSSSCANDL